MTALLLILLGGCAEDGLDSGGADSTFCQDASTVTWASWGQGFLTESCQTCHASTSPDRHGAPEGSTFDSEAEVLRQRDAILDRATGDAPTMPPAGGVEDEDRQRLEIWLRCWLEES